MDGGSAQDGSDTLSSALRDDGCCDGGCCDGGGCGIGEPTPCGGGAAAYKVAPEGGGWSNGGGANTGGAGEGVAGRRDGGGCCGWGDGENGCVDDGGCGGEKCANASKGCCGCGG